MSNKPTIARIWRGRTRRDIADRYEIYLRAEGIPPLEKTALGVQHANVYIGATSQMRMPSVAPTPFRRAVG